MQLILILAVLLMLGSGGSHRPEISSEVSEILKYISEGNGEMDKIIKEAEHVTEIVNAFAPILFDGNKSQATSNDANSRDGAPLDGNDSSSIDSGIKKSDGGSIVLKPIANIADDSIYNALSKAIA